MDSANPAPSAIDQVSHDFPNNDDAIRQGKQRAREHVAALQDHTSASLTNSPAPTQARQLSLSRKRSRSGSRKLNTTVSSDDPGTPLVDPHLKQYIQRDQAFGFSEILQEDFKKDLIQGIHDETNFWRQERRRNRLDPGWIYGEGYQGYGNGWTATPPHPNGLPTILYPSQHRRPGRRITRTLRYQRKDRDAQKERTEDLVPVRLDLEIDKLRLRDTFTWNLNDHIVSPMLFAESLIEDFQIPADQRRSFLEQIHSSMVEQIQDFHPHLFIEEEPLDPHLPYLAYKNDDMRILVKLNITIGRHSLVDQFEWDINNLINSPEDFARKMVVDLCLSGEFMTSIAHSIREQTQTFTKSLFIAGHPFDGRPVEDLDLRDAMQPSPLPTPFRAYQQAREFAPFFYELNEADLERTEDAFSREQRQQKRSVNRKGGPTLPELKERLRTVRTMIVSSVVPGAADTTEDSGLYRPTRRTGRGRKSYRVDDEGSDLSGSEEESAPGTPALQGTSRVKRGAASAAQAAMRAAQPSSLTPEFQQPRPKRFGWTYEPNPATGAAGMMLKLKMPRTRYRELIRDVKRDEIVRKEMARSQMHQTNYRTETPQRGQDVSMPPPTHGRQSLLPQAGVFRPPSSDPITQVSQADGTNDTPPPPRPNPHAYPPQGPVPPAPPWLTAALAELKKQHPDESFASAMRFNSKENAWQPRIKCNDCANNIMYKTDESEPVKNFLMHFGNQDHQRIIREKKLSEGR